ncbi:polysaccharide deacetylase [Clostridium sp. A1-XYC3]|uniref:Polysaccharide deacetylase n=1 Tax=Clostridium tanneri TaxID=3037988 RepID=A0ABU4JV45_9CLOT|nr:polysaccharide deacetylase family protein [Clostridium sp. A1-XYC3]MDW8802025.1 polysaccharide deacetylase [Clostridium sp. A1-XYC3]
MKKNKRGFIRIVLGIIILFSLSSAAGFKFAERSKSSINIVSTSNKSDVSSNIQASKDNGQTGKTKNENKGDSDKKSGQDKTAEVKENKPQDAPAKGDKIAYLTFDDGPTQNITPHILDVLKNNNVKATFFVIGKMAEQSPELLKREKEEGHVIANHTYSHNYGYIYSSPEIFIKDLEKGTEVVNSIIGEHNKTLIRFPGGSFGRQAYKRAAENHGYHYVDWNALNGDAEVQSASVERLISRLKETTQGQKELIILMHDAPGKRTTVEALPQIIEYLKANGYVFKTLE